MHWYELVKLHGTPYTCIFISTPGSMAGWQERTLISTALWQETALMSTALWQERSLMSTALISTALWCLWCRPSVHSPGQFDGCMRGRGASVVDG